LSPRRQTSPPSPPEPRSKKRASISPASVDVFTRNDLVVRAEFVRQQGDLG
jgi:hypothetical protein